ncbi:hypothetical protein BDY19DRAFT_236478 [Irpex rosettiformis]|uniref:Uncharacterized protein n=1 Tax=Irpex rosettiformis TaxID=378272 RepID=A0ACB8TZZ4_9APHY|nr:hypothetical protein BDY19DRAFT_236478 [Irpex rosettiformis]
MPSILNLKFKGNKSFVPFSNLGDVDSLTKTWKVCTKVAGFLEQGQRLENLSWRLWHLQNLMVDSDNAKSKREFRKLSKTMGDKLDKEKGRSIEELQAPGFRRNHSTDIIQQRAIEKEREREAHRDGLLNRMQFTFSVDQPSAAATSAPCQKPDLKPSLEFKDGSGKRGRPVTRSTTTAADNEQPLTARGRKQQASNSDAYSTTSADDPYASAALRFPTLFSTDFGPSALLNPTPTLTNVMTYGEGANANGNDGLAIPRPTIELPLDELLSADSPGGWSSGFNTTESRNSDGYVASEDADMKLQNDENMLNTSSALRTHPQLSQIEDVVPRTITPSRLGPNPAPSATAATTGKRPSLHLRTQSASTRSSGPSATPVNGQPSINNNSAPGGVKAECSNCGATHTPLWRRGLNDELNCNACGLYCKLHKRPRPKSMRNSHGEGRAQTVPRQESQEVVAQCYNCHTTATPLWRKDDEGKTVCNACGLYYKLHGSARPISMKSDVIRKRARHDARRASGNSSETPSASPGASRHDSYSQTQSELMSALGASQQHADNGENAFMQFSYGTTFPGPYHPDYLMSNPLAYPGEDNSDVRSPKRRRMSSASSSEPPSSTSSYSSYTDSSFSSASSSQRSLEFPFSYSTYGLYRGPATASFWHPPMLPPDNSPQFIHPPMLPPEDSPMDYLHAMHNDETDALFNTYLHPPMVPPEDSGKGSLESSHPPMVPQEWGTAYDFSSNDTAMQAY